MNSARSLRTYTIHTSIFNERSVAREKISLVGGRRKNKYAVKNPVDVCQCGMRVKNNSVSTILPTATLLVYSLCNFCNYILVVDSCISDSSTILLYSKMGHDKSPLYYGSKRVLLSSCKKNTTER